MWLGGDDGVEMRRHRRGRKRRVGSLSESLKDGLVECVFMADFDFLQCIVSAKYYTRYLAELLRQH